MIDNRSTDTNTRNLTQLLNHLDRHVAKPVPLHNDNDDAYQDVKPTAFSAFERQKLRANFEHARALLLRLEHDSTSINVASRKRAVQIDLRGKREQIKRLQLRIQELEDASESGSDEEDETEQDAEHSGRQAAETDQVVVVQDYGTAADSGSNMRQRPGTRDRDSTNKTAYSSGVHSTDSSTKRPDDEAESRDRTLTTDRKEQEQIMQDLLSLTRQLKSSASVFQGSLENEKSLLGKASRGLDQNVDGMDAAGQRIGTLRKMTEGRGFFARLKLYGFIAMLWLVALVMVFILPKLRF